jgi:alpha-beta hydrolase superfamily lysophospholipase
LAESQDTINAEKNRFANVNVFLRLLKANQRKNLQTETNGTFFVDNQLAAPLQLGMRKWFSFAGLLVLLIWTALVFDSRFSYLPAVIALPEDLDGYLQKSESAIHSPPLKENTEKLIIWANPQHLKTKLAFVYMHGFSASRRELSPVVEDLAQKYQANLFFTRLKAHGQDGEGFASVAAGDWLKDADEALAIGHRLGEKVIVLGQSTGATLATYMAWRDPSLKAVILFSPNFALAQWYVRYFSGQFGRMVLPLVIGSHRSFPASNAGHERFWTTRYRIEGIASLMDLLQYVAEIPIEKIHIPILLLYTKHDSVVSLPAMQDRFARFGSEIKEMIDVPGATRHELAGEILSPQTTPVVEKKISGFLLRLDK